MAKRFKPGSFTLRLDGFASELKTPVKLSKPEITDPSSKEIININAIWDTGATNSVITKNIADKLGLVPTGKSYVQGVNTNSEVNCYIVRFRFDKIKDVITPVTECPGLPGADALIGMDIICLGDFAISNKDKKTTFTFQIPSTHDFDFVEEQRSLDKEEQLLNLNREKRRKAQKKLRKKNKLA